MIKFFTDQYTPAYKIYNNVAGGTTFTIWTPVSGKAVALTDVHVSAAAAGTIRILFERSADVTAAVPTLAFEALIAGSGSISHHFEAPLVSPYVNGLVRCVSGANGPLFVNISGFEI